MSDEQKQIMVLFEELLSKLEDYDRVVRKYVREEELPLIVSGSIIPGIRAKLILERVPETSGATMSEKLTENKVGELCFHGKSWDTLRDELWSAIEADREAIREETRAEVLKDRYELGEAVEVLARGEWEPAIITAIFRKDRSFIPLPPVRRPPKMRPMTREEMLSAYLAHKENAGRRRETILTELVIGAWNLETVLKQNGLPTEVPE